MLFIQSVLFIKLGAARSGANARNLVIDSYMRSVRLGYFIGMFSRRQLLYAVRQNTYFHFVLRLKAQLIRNFKPFAIGVVAVLLRADVIHILAACVGRMNTYHPVVGHIAVAFKRTVSEIFEFTVCQRQRQLKAQARQPNNIFANIAENKKTISNNIADSLFVGL